MGIQQVRRLLYRVRGYCIVQRWSYFVLPLDIKQFEEFVSEGFPGDAVEHPVNTVIQILHDVHEDTVVRVRWFSGLRAENSHRSRQEDKRNGNSDQHSSPPGGGFIQRLICGLCIVRRSVSFSTFSHHQFVNNCRVCDGHDSKWSE